jgi:glycopeptide antibiotics resistance protein
MPTDQIDVPPLPVMVPLGVVLMIVSWLVLRRRGPLTAWRLGAVWAGCWWAVAVLGATMLPLHLGWGAYTGEPGYDRILPVPLITMRPSDFVLNIVMTLPLAALLRMIFGVRDRSRVVLIGFLLSLTIESTQLVLALTLQGTRWADINDLISNTFGAYLGFLAVQRLLRDDRFRRFADRCTFRRTESRARETVR